MGPVRRLSEKGGLLASLTNLGLVPGTCMVKGGSQVCKFFCDLRRCAAMHAYLHNTHLLNK